ncbi:MAG: hypothetical protein ABW098_07550 [Candidatus Thiodiazotropha sp.]
MSKLQTRRQFIRNTGYVAMGIAFMGCEFGAPVWSAIPPQTWTVGVPVYLDLNDYVSDPNGDPLTFTLDTPLPDGVTLNGSVISGTPTAATASASYAVTADDGKA